MTEFTQLYLRPKIFLLGSSLAFSPKEDPVRCAKVCDKSWVILEGVSKTGKKIPTSFMDGPKLEIGKESEVLFPIYLSLIFKTRLVMLV